jgi:hypothetical protein
MKKLTVLAALAISGSAFAMDTHMDLMGRFDYLHTETKTNGANKTTAGNYSPNYLRWKTTAKFNETTTAELNLDLAADHAAATTRTLSGMVDVAAVTKVLGGGFSAIIGKQPVLVGGRENDYKSRDVYTTSLFNDAISDNQIGLTAAYNVMGQDFYLQHVESTGATALTDKKITGLAYYGNFMNGMLSPIVSYHKVGTDTSAKYDIMTTVGVKYTMGAIVAEFDYLMLKKEQVGTADQKLNSMVAHVRYNMGMYNPFAKYIMETGKDAFAMETGTTTKTTRAGGPNVTKSERTAWELGLEVVPNKDEDMRYHVVYSSSKMEDKTRTTGANQKFEDTRLYAGVAFGFNILK